MSQKILVYGNRKTDPEYFDASTPEKELASYLYLFQCLKNSWDVYDDLQKYNPKNWDMLCGPCQKDIHKYCEGQYQENCFCVQTDDCVINTKRLKMQDAVISKQTKLFDKANKGDAVAAKQLMQLRKDYEYEHVRIAEVRDPDKNEET